MAIDKSTCVAKCLAAAATRRRNVATTASDPSALRVPPHPIRQAKNRKGDVSLRQCGRAGRKLESNAEAGSSGGWLPRMAHRGWQVLKGTESS